MMSKQPTTNGTNDSPQKAQLAGFRASRTIATVVFATMMAAFIAVFIYFIQDSPSAKGTETAELKGDEHLTAEVQTRRPATSRHTSAAVHIGAQSRSKRLPSRNQLLEIASTSDGEFENLPLKELDNVLDAQERNLGWERDSKENGTQFLRKSGLVDTRLHESICGSHFCRLAFYHDDNAAQLRFSEKAAEDGPWGAAPTDVVKNPDGSSAETFMYIFGDDFQMLMDDARDGAARLE